MLYFAFLGHHLYAKSTYLYLQSTEELLHTHPDIHRMFKYGINSIRRMDKFWAALSTELMIKQEPMQC